VEREAMAVALPTTAASVWPRFGNRQLKTYYRRWLPGSTKILP